MFSRREYKENPMSDREDHDARVRNNVTGGGSGEVRTMGKVCAATKMDATSQCHFPFHFASILKSFSCSKTVRKCHLTDLFGSRSNRSET